MELVAMGNGLAQLRSSLVGVARWKLPAAGTGTNARSDDRAHSLQRQQPERPATRLDGQDKMLRDDVTWVNGNHVFQFGGLIQHNLRLPHAHRQRRLD
jgi:hypothetical protein